MTGIDIFNKIVQSPETFEITGIEGPVSEKAKKRIEQDLEAFCEKLEGFIETYRDEIHADYYSQEDSEDWSEFEATEESIRAIKFDLMRTIFNEALEQSSQLFDLNRGDILKAYGFEHSQYFDSYFLMGKDTYFTDEDALRIADRIYSETLAQLEDIRNGKRSVKTSIQNFLEHNNNGIMYQEPEL